ncbi:MAG: response regulator [Hyphomonadaceae bacterium]
MVLAPAHLAALIVDDHEASRALNVRAVRSLGINGVREAESGAQALDLLRALPADLILADHRMPGMNGAEFIAAVRADPALRHARILLITGFGDARIRDTAREAGADAVVVKPAPPSVVARAVAELLAR